MKNLPNKVDMTLVPKGEADLALQTANQSQYPNLTSKK